MPPSPAFSRRQFLRLISALPLAAATHRWQPTAQAPPGSPNILIILFDTLSARHMSLYGYERETTPHIARFAERATIFHNHTAAGNYTTPGTASLLTGVYPWTHRALPMGARVTPPYVRDNLFAAFDDYYRFAYSQNPLAAYLLDQFGADLDHTYPLTAYALFDSGVLHHLFPADWFIAHSGDLLLIRDERSLLLSQLNVERLTTMARRLEARHQDRYPRGLPRNGAWNIYPLELAIDGILEMVRSAPQPFLGYIHLWPPHDPYTGRAPFVGQFEEDGYRPPAKEEHPLSMGVDRETVNASRRAYDEYILTVDAEFGRLVDGLASSGQLDNTILLLTSDHGELFERGIRGHITFVMYEPLLHIPLLIAAPGQERQAITVPTSAVDVLPTLLHMTGRAGGTHLSGEAVTPETTVRPIFAVEAKTNARLAPLSEMTLTIRDGADKLILYQYGGQQRVELYDLAEDPEELSDLAKRRPERVATLKARLEAELARHDAPYRRGR